MRPRNISRIAALFLLCFVAACEEHGTIVEFSPDIPPPTFIGGATCDYGPTKIEKQFYNRLSGAGRITVQTKPGDASEESHAFKLQGHGGEFVSWFGIVRNIKPNAERRGGMLLIENKYFDDLTDCNFFESISICGGGDFESELTGMKTIGRSSKPIMYASGMQASSLSSLTVRTAEILNGKRT